MADGINQSVAGATITIQNDAHGDADLDGVLDKYHPQDIVLKALASGDAINLGTNTPSFRFRASVQNGDGVGSLTTTFDLSNCYVSFDAGKTYLTHATGRANRWFKLGTKVQGVSGKPGGKDGVFFDLGGAITLTGNFQIYGSRIRTAANAILNIQPLIAPAVAEVIASMLESGGSISVGSTAFPLNRIYNVELILGPNPLNTISNIAADEIERIWVVMNGNNYGINTSGFFIIKEPTFVGTPNNGDIRYTGGVDAHVISATWSGNNVKVHEVLIVGVYLNEWEQFDTISFDPETGLIVPAVPIKITDTLTGQVIYEGLTDALGGIAFNNDPDGLDRGVFDNAVKVERHSGNAPRVDEALGPWTCEVNVAGPDQIPAYANYSFTFPWRYMELPNGYGKQWEPMVLPIRMVAPGPPAVPPDPIRYEDLPIEADGVERIEAEVPERAA